MLAYTDLALKNAFAPPQASPAASTAVGDLLLKVSQDIAFGKVSIKQGFRPRRRRTNGRSSAAPPTT